MEENSRGKSEWGIYLRHKTWVNTGKKEKKKKKDSCIIWIYLNKFHSCFLLNTVKKLSSDWSEWWYIYTAYSVLDVYWCCIPGLESNEISLDQVTLHQNKQHQNSRVRSLSRPRPPCKHSCAAIIAEPSVNILFMPVIKAGRGTSTCSTSWCGHIRFPWNYISPTHACSCGMQQRKKSNHKHKKYWRSEWCMRVKTKMLNNSHFYYNANNFNSINNIEYWMRFWIIQRYHKRKLSGVFKTKCFEVYEPHSHWKFCLATKLRAKHQTYSALIEYAQPLCALNPAFTKKQVIYRHLKL